MVKLEGISGKTISIGCCFPPKFANSGTVEISRGGITAGSRGVSGVAIVTTVDQEGPE